MRRSTRTLLVARSAAWSSTTSLVIALHPQNDSGYFGIAILSKDDDGNVDVEVYLAEPGETSDATPVA